MQAKEKLTVAARRAKVAELTDKGWTEREIAHKLGVSRTTVWTDKQVAAGAQAAE